MSNKDLRERVIERIQQEGAFNIDFWTPKHAKENGCGSACCIAGHIDIEANGNPDPDSFGIINRARAAWANVYGWDSANRLDFFHAGTNKPIPEITAEDAVAHLRSV